MCGIVGYIGTKRQAYPMLIKGLKRLEYRGYDSAGIALINSDNCLNVYKSKGKVSDLETFCADKNRRNSWYSPYKVGYTWRAFINECSSPLFSVKEFSYYS